MTSGSVLPRFDREVRTLERAEGEVDELIDAYRKNLTYDSSAPRPAGVVKRLEGIAALAGLLADGLRALSNMERNILLFPDPAPPGPWSTGIEGIRERLYAPLPMVHIDDYRFAQQVALAGEKLEDEKAIYRLKKERALTLFNLLPRDLARSGPSPLPDGVLVDILERLRDCAAGTSVEMHRTLNGSETPFRDRGGSVSAHRVVHLAPAWRLARAAWDLLEWSPNLRAGSERRYTPGRLLPNSSFTAEQKRELPSLSTFLDDIHEAVTGEPGGDKDRFVKELALLAKHCPELLRLERERWELWASGNGRFEPDDALAAEIECATAGELTWRPGDSSKVPKSLGRKSLRLRNLYFRKSGQLSRASRAIRKSKTAGDNKADC